MRRATETAAAVGAALGLEAEELPYVHELGLESFEQAVARVRRLKAELEGAPAGERPLIVTHGIFIRFFLLDSMLGDEFAPRDGGPDLAPALPQLRPQHLRARPGSRPGRWGDARLGLLRLDGAALG